MATRYLSLLGAVYRRIEKPLIGFHDHFVLAMDRPAERSLSFQLGGGEGCEAVVALLPAGRAELPDFTLTTLGGDRLRPRRVDGRVEYRVPADGRVTLTW